MVRCFAALPIPEASQGRLERAVGPLRDRGWPVRWVRPEGTHITLRFYGEILQDRAEAVAESLDFAVAGIGSFGVSVSGFGAFPDPDRPRVLWAGVEAPPALELLQDRIESRAEGLGFAGEGGIFRPHVTIGRVREGERLSKADTQRLLETPFSDSFHADRIVLFRSTPGPGGAVYAPIHEAPLTG